ncbi:MAG: PspC domain-containing protein [Propionibacteriaceae bacterium]|nr:PspC domain-containing protein [Propionibacteriaceae bacterium]
MSELAVPREKLSRPLDAALIGGVCAAFAQHFHIPVLLIRTIAVIILPASMFGTWGIWFYLLVWLLIPPRAQRSSMALESAERAGMRAAGRKFRPIDLAQAGALALLGLGCCWALWLFGAVDPVLMAANGIQWLGVVLIWWQADHAASPRARETSWWRRLLYPLIAHWSTILVVTVGLLLVLVPDFYYQYLPAVRERPNGERTMIALVIVLFSVAVVVAPWIVRNRRELAQALADRRVSDARADIAAHLHDSVLQTLALIQRSAADEKTVLALARRQERELRVYLYGEVSAEAMLVAELGRRAQQVEDDYGVEVELVSVGDAPLSDQLRVLVKAAQEALVNAAKHSGAAVVDIYAEVDDDLAAVFVRDRGAGFDLGRIDSDRMGVRESIIERMERAGGRAIIKTAPGEGTEVRLELPL